MPPDLPTFEGYDCLSGIRVGERWVLQCRSKEVQSPLLLWEPAAKSVRRLEHMPIDGHAEAPTRAPWILERVFYMRWWHSAKARFLKVADGPLRWDGDTSQRLRLGFAASQGGLELRRYDVESATYDVLREYAADACPGGQLGRAADTVMVDFERYATVTCVRPTGPKQTDSVRLWSEVLDLEGERVWRTKLSVREITREGVIVLSDNPTYDAWSSFGRVYVAAFATRQ
jgi:hypothetical protein